MMGYRILILIFLDFCFNEDVIVGEFCLDPIMDSMELNEEGRKFYLEEMRKMLP